jgi:predicted alpha/beta-fold hydrolase
MYRDAERILVEDVGGVFLFHGLTGELRKPYLKGLKVNKYGYSFFTWIGMVHTNMYISR